MKTTVTVTPTPSEAANPTEYPCLKEWVKNDNVAGRLVVLFWSQYKGIAMEHPLRPVSFKTEEWMPADCSDYWSDFEGTVNIQIEG